MPSTAWYITSSPAPITPAPYNTLPLLLVITPPSTLPYLSTNSVVYHIVAASTGNIYKSSDGGVTYTLALPTPPTTSYTLAVWGGVAIGSNGYIFAVGHQVRNSPLSIKSYIAHLSSPLTRSLTSSYVPLITISPPTLSQLSPPHSLQLISPSNSSPHLCPSPPPCPYPPPVGISLQLAHLPGNHHRHTHRLRRLLPYLRWPGINTLTHHIDMPY